MLLLAGMGALLLAGCATGGRSPHVDVGVTVGGGPSSWASAHGPRVEDVLYRHYYYYHYYPTSGVYLNMSTGAYFYLNEGTWQVAMRLPTSVRLDTGSYVSLELETDRPYLYYDEHKVTYKGHGRSKGQGKAYLNNNE